MYYGVKVCIFVTNYCLLQIPYYVVNTLATVDTCIVLKQWIINMVGAETENTSEVGVYMKNASMITHIMLRISFTFSMKYHKIKFDNALQTLCTSSFYKDLHTIQVSKA